MLPGPKPGPVTVPDVPDEVCGRTTVSFETGYPPVAPRTSRMSRRVTSRVARLGRTPCWLSPHRYRS